MTETPAEPQALTAEDKRLPRCPCECGCTNRTAFGNRCTICGPGPCRRKCSGCGGRRWSEDENWTPDDPRTWKGERSHGDGLIPCGFCNEGGWDTPDYEPEATPEPPEDERVSR